MLVSPRHYYGLPRHCVADLERVLQATVEAIYQASIEIWSALGEGGRRSFGDADFSIERTAGGLIIDDHSASWWAVIRWGQPFKSDAITDFWVHSKRGDLPNTFDWKKLDDDFMHDQCDYHMQARRSHDDAAWSGPLHQIDLKHPLLMILLLAVKDVHGGSVT